MEEADRVHFDLSGPLSTIRENGFHPQVPAILQSSVTIQLCEIFGMREKKQKKEVQGSSVLLLSILMLFPFPSV